MLIKETPMQKRWVKIAAAVVGFIVLVIILIPFLINADTFRPRIEDQLSHSLGRRVTLGHLSFSLFSRSLIADDISIADDPAFSTSPFLGAKSLHIGVEIGPFVFGRQVRITNLTVESPTIQLVRGQNAAWNFSSFGDPPAGSSSPQQNAISDLTVAELKIKNGTATVSSISATGKPFVYTGINLAVQQLSFAKPFPFQLSAKLPGEGSLDLNGTAGPLAEKNAADSPFHATLQLKHFDTVAAGVVDLSQGISMVVDMNAQLASDGTNLTSNGKIQAAKLQLARTGSPAPQPVDIDYSITENLQTRAGQISDISVHTGSVAAHVNGSFQRNGGAITVNLRATAPNLPIDQLEQLLPAFGVRLPSGSSLRGGALTANLSVTGPATASTITGPVEVDNTLLAGFDIGAKIGGLNPFGGAGKGTKIQTLRADVNSSSQSTRLTNIFADLPQVGTASGNGTVSPSGTLDFKLVAKFSPASGVGMVAGKAVNAVGGTVGTLLHPKTKPTGSSTIPITVTGTTTAPSIHASPGAIFK